MDNSIAYKLNRFTKALCSSAAVTRRVASVSLLELLTSQSDTISADDVFKSIVNNVINYQWSSKSESNAQKYGLCLCALTLVHTNNKELLNHKQISLLIKALCSNVSSSDNHLNGFVYQALGDLQQLISTETVKFLQLGDILSGEFSQFNLYQCFLLLRLRRAHPNCEKTLLAPWNKVDNDSIVQAIATKIPLGKPNLCLLIFLFFWAQRDKALLQLFWREVSKVLLSEDCGARRVSLFDFMFTAILCPKVLRNPRQVAIIWSPEACASLHDTLANPHKTLHKICVAKMQSLRSTLSARTPTTPGGTDDAAVAAAAESQAYFHKVVRHIFVTVTALPGGLVDKNVPGAAKFLPTLLPHLMLNDAVVMTYVQQLMNSCQQSTSARDYYLQLLSQILSQCGFPAADKATQCETMLWSILDVLFRAYLTDSNGKMDLDLSGENSTGGSESQSHLFRVLSTLCQPHRGKRMQESIQVNYETVLQHLLKQGLAWCREDASRKHFRKTLKLSRGFFQNKKVHHPHLTENIRTAFGLLHSHLCLHWLGGASNIQPLLDDIMECFNRLTTSLTETSKSHTHALPTGEDLPWMNVMTDALLTLLSNPSQVLRRTVQMVYQRFMTYTSADNVQVIVDRLFSRVEDELQDDEDEDVVVKAGEEDDDDEEEDMDKDESSQESSDDADEAPNNEVLIQARNLIKSALGKAALVKKQDSREEDEEVEEEAHQDNDAAMESDGDLSDDAMFAINDKLALAVAALQKQNRKQKMRQQRMRLMENKMRFFDLIELLAKESIDGKVLCLLTKSLVQLLSDFQLAELHSRARKVIMTLKNRTVTIQDKADAASALAQDCVAALLTKNTMKTDLQFLSNSLIFLHRCISAHTVRSALGEQLEELFTKKCHSNLAVVLNFYYERIPDDLWPKRDLLLKCASSSSFKPILRLRAFTFLFILCKRLSEKNCALRASDDQFVPALWTAALTVLLECSQKGEQPALCEKSLSCCVSALKVDNSLIQAVSSQQFEELEKCKAIVKWKADWNFLKKLRQTMQTNHEMEVHPVARMSRKRKLSTGDPIVEPV